MSLPHEESERLAASMRFWLKRWARSPLSYVVECLGAVPTHQQSQVLKAFEHHRFVAVRSGHGIGKSKLTGWLVNWWLDTRGKRAPITGAGGDQLEDVVWPEVVSACESKPAWLASKYRSAAGELRYWPAPENWRAILRTTRLDNNDALQGFHDCMFFIDEGSGVKDGVFEVASGALGDPGCYGLMTGNPTRLSGYFYRVFHGKSFWYPLAFSSEDSIAEEEYRWPYVDPLGNIVMMRCHGRQTREWVENMRQEYGLNSNVYRYRVLGEFASASGDSLVEGRDLSRVEYQNLQPKQGVRRMGVDPAWTGDDDTGVVVREGDAILYATSWHGFDLVESFQRIRLLFQEWECDWLHIDCIGVGAGLYDMFRHSQYGMRMGWPVVRVMASERAPEDGDAACRTLRDWLWWKARKFFKKHHVVHSCEGSSWEALSAELSAPGYAYKSGQIIAESKEDMRKRGVRSPNMADALNLTFYGDFETFKVRYMTTGELQARLRRKRPPVRSWKTR